MIWAAGNLNYRTMQVMNNAEITALKKILGLQTGKHYENADALRYGRVMIMADQDHDGTHILHQKRSKTV
jgi:DNA gyrase/topoisomerase IV subunit B